MTKAYSYIRFSTPEQLKGDSLRRQKEASEQYANFCTSTLGHPCCAATSKVIGQFFFFIVLIYNKILIL